MGKREFRWGILGPGRIARKFASSLPFSQHGILNAVASSSLERASSFGAEFGTKNAFDTYEGMINSGLVDAVYVARPHTFHKQDVELCLQHGIPVLCEKPLTTNLNDSLKLTTLSKDKGVFLMEGLWTSCLPSFQKALEWIKEGQIGEPLHASADFGHPATRDFSQRHFNPELGGGAMKDIGIYPLALFMKVFGHGLKIQSSSIQLENGVDAQVVFQGTSASGQQTFQGMVSFLGATPSVASIIGTEGRIQFSPQWFRPVEISLERPGKEVLIFDGKTDSFGFQFEADEVERCVSARLIESPNWSHADSIEAARLIELAEKQ